MKGLSDQSVRRLEELEAKPELESFHRGELRAMAHSRPTPEQAARVERLLGVTTVAGASEAFERGAARARSSSEQGRGYS